VTIRLAASGPAGSSGWIKTKVSAAVTTECWRYIRRQTPAPSAQAGNFLPQSLAKPFNKCVALWGIQYSHFECPNLGTWGETWVPSTYPKLWVRDHF
jgi:hypothetical protein